MSQYKWERRDKKHNKHLKMKVVGKSARLWQEIIIKKSKELEDEERYEQDNSRKGT